MAGTCATGGGARSTLLHRCSRCGVGCGVHDDTIARHQFLEHDEHGLGASDVGVVKSLNMQVRFGTVAGIAAATESFSTPYALVGLDRDAVLLEVTQRYDHAFALEQNMVTGQSLPAARDAPSLGQRVPDRREPAMGIVVGRVGLRGDDPAICGSQNGATESRKPGCRFRCKQGAQRDRRASPCTRDGNEIDRIRGGEQSCAVIRNPIRVAVLDEPVPGERILQVHRAVAIRLTHGGSLSITKLGEVSIRFCSEEPTAVGSYGSVNSIVDVEGVKELRNVLFDRT